MPAARRRALAVALLPLTAALALFLAPAAGAKVVWLCKPGSSDDPCSPGLATTRYAAGGDVLGVAHVHRARHRRADCFYVYPTVSDQPRPQATRAVDDVLRSIALWQAARYSRDCRVFAPVYRQITLRGLGAPASVTPAMRRTAYLDVRRAWRTYLRRFNYGRPVVLIGHSQGTYVLRQLVAREIDGRRAVRERLVSALLLGGDVTVKQGHDRGGDFRHVRACRARGQLGCVIAFSTFEGPVPETAFFGRADEPGLQRCCARTRPRCAAGRGASRRSSRARPSPRARSVRPRGSWAGSSRIRRPPGSRSPMPTRRVARTSAARACSRWPRSPARGRSRPSRAPTGASTSSTRTSPSASSPTSSGTRSAPGSGTRSL